MKDYLNINKIDKNILSQIKCLSETSELCNKCIKDPSDENIKKIIENITKNEEKMMKVKENIAIMINTIEDNYEENSIKVEKEKNGVKID
ncbi:MAG: hypothetical protein ACOCP8_07745 [archaeon]